MVNTSDDVSDVGLRQGLGSRHVRMIAVGGTIGVGLFLGSGKGISVAGPSLVILYVVTGAFIFIVIRALGEMMLYRPVNGSFAEYAREFLGPLYGFVTGWAYWFLWTVTGMAELTAAGIYVQYWFPSVPRYVTALTVLVLLVLLNLVAVGAFGEAEFWFASIKIAAILSLVIGGISVMLFGIGHAGQSGTITNLWNSGGVAPHGWVSALLAFQIVVFAYQGAELVGMTAAETKNRSKVLPKAINSVPWRIGLFYVGSLVVLLSLVPWTNFGPDRSPFVQAMARIGIPGAGAIMNFVVLTAALSSCSSGLFSNGRLLKRLGDDGFAPRRLSVTSRRLVPARGILASGLVMIIAVGINYIAPAKAFSYITSVATVGTIWTWGVILACHLVYRRRVAKGEARLSPFRLPWATPLCWTGLTFLTFVTVLLGFDADQRIALYALPLWAVLLVGGYFLTQRRADGRTASGQAFHRPHTDQTNR